MSDAQPLNLIPPGSPDRSPAPGRAPPRARGALFKRLADVVCLPASRVNAFERSMIADLLVEMLREASVEERLKTARRLASLTEIPHVLARFLLRDVFEVSRQLIENCASLSDAELVDCAHHATTEHRRAIAQRRGLGELVADALVERIEAPVVETVLRNELCRLSFEALELVVAASRDEPRYLPLLLKRPELRPHHAYVMFWWADADARRTILQRFAVSREVLQEAAGDVFAMANQEAWEDPLTRKALQFIERRQRNRAALARSPYESLDAAVAASQTGMTREAAEEISHLSGVKPMTGAKIFTDQGGEPLAILCKATGLPRTALRQLWKGLRRPEGAELERVVTIFDMVAVDRAQTVLRYWNWALSSALTPALLRAIRDGDNDGVDQYSPPQRAAMLALRRDLAR